MSVWLRKRLVMWFVGAFALALVGFRVTAQSGENPYRPFATPGEAARGFGRLLLLAEREHELPMDSADYYLKSRVISKQSDRELGFSAIDILLKDLAKHRALPDFNLSTERRENGRIVLDIAPSSKPLAAPVVMIAEEGGYRVDLVATYAKRLDLKPGDLERVIFQKTEIALEGLRGKDTPYMQKRICQSNLREISLGLSQYMQDYDEKFPIASKWTGGVAPYVRSEAIFTCPALPKTQKYGYAYNFSLSSAFGGDIIRTAETVALYETSRLHRNSFGLGEHLARRHDGGANYAFVDGHVKWFAKGMKPRFKLKP